MTNKKKEEKRNQDREALWVRELREISEPDTLKNDGGELKATFYFDDIKNWMSKQLLKIVENCKTERNDSELQAMPKGKFKEGYLMGYSDCLEIIEDSISANQTISEK